MQPPGTTAYTLYVADVLKEQASEWNEVAAVKFVFNDETGEVDILFAKNYAAAQRAEKGPVIAASKEPPTNFRWR